MAPGVCPHAPATLPAAVGAGAVSPLAHSSMHGPEMYLWSPLAGIKMLTEERKGEQRKKRHRERPWDIARGEGAGEGWLLNATSMISHS